MLRYQQIASWVKPNKGTKTVIANAALALLGKGFGVNAGSHCSG